MAITKKQTPEPTVEFEALRRGVVRLRILGSTPFIANRMSEKVKGDLLNPPPPMNAAEKASRLKHQPLQEYRDSPYRMRGGQPTELAVLGAMFHKAMASAAVDMPGAAKSQIGRLSWVQEDRIPLYGIPQMMMAVTVQAGISGAPDVRTRVIVPQWACELTIQFAVPILSELTILKLVSAAGLIRGIGDWRIEKGSGNYGGFDIVEENDPRWLDIVANGGGDAQRAALEDPEFYDDETESMYRWFLDDVRKRGREKLLLGTNHIEHQVETHTNGVEVTA